MRIEGCDEADESLRFLEADESDLLRLPKIELRIDSSVSVRRRRGCSVAVDIAVEGRGMIDSGSSVGLDNTEMGIGMRFPVLLSALERPKNECRFRTLRILEEEACGSVDGLGLGRTGAHLSNVSDRSLVCASPITAPAIVVVVIVIASSLTIYRLSLVNEECRVAIASVNSLFVDHRLSYIGDAGTVARQSGPARKPLS